MTASPGADRPLHLRLRRPTPALLGLPWATPLARWPKGSAVFRRLGVGPSRHHVRFAVIDGETVALKEEPIDVARREYDVLREMEVRALPAVRAIGIAERPDDATAILATAYLRHSLQYRRLMGRLPLISGGYRDRLLDAMASLLVDLHRAGVYWGDCSLANTLLRRDGDRLQAHLVDAETSEIHPRLSDGQRAADLDVLVENVAFGLADLAASQGQPEAMDDQLAAASAVRGRYEDLWSELFRVETVAFGDAFAIEARVRRLNELGFAVEEIELEPSAGDVERGDIGRGDAERRSIDGQARLRVVVSERDFHTRELRRRARINALEGQARLLLNDMREYRAWLACVVGRAGLPRGGGRTLAGRAPRAVAGATGARPSVRDATRSRRTATCWSTSGCSPSRPAATSASKRPSPRTWTSARRRRRSPDQPNLARCRRVGH